MSSGNPFRASLLHNPASSSPVAQTSFISLDSSVPGAREDGRSALQDPVAPPPRTKKHVRIEPNTTYIIPPHPDAGDVLLDSLGRSAAVAAAAAERFGNSYSADRLPATPLAASFDDGSAIAGDPNTRRGHSNMASWDIATAPPSGYHSPVPMASPSSVPFNPFSRTLASIESQEQGAAEDRTLAEKPALGNSRLSLDVESFKNLLMTGTPGPRQSGPPVQYPASASATQFESSSGTDTSSISRGSFFEPPPDTRVETRATSYDMADSGDEGKPERPTDTTKAKKKPPPAPKHRYGKPVTPRQPKVVPFESFFATEPAPATRSRGNSDATRRLPPTPVMSHTPPRVSTVDATNEGSVSGEQPSNESSTSSEILQPQKKAPPPVPLARRQSQLRSSSNSNRSRSNSSLTMSSQVSAEATLSSPAPSNNKDPLATTKSPPPPPRPRHSARLTDISMSSANSSTTELPQPSASIRTTASAQEGPSISRRSTLEFDSATDLGRSSSIASNRNSRIVSNESSSSITSTMAPPPPPPPRRRQSHRSSLDQQRPTAPSPSSPPPPPPPPPPTSTSRRTSLENRRSSLENKRTSLTSESSPRHEFAVPEKTTATTTTTTTMEKESGNALLEGETGDGIATTTTTTTAIGDGNGNDNDNGTAGGKEGVEEEDHGKRSDSSNILDDMDKFQREIDELRLRFKQSG